MAQFWHDHVHVLSPNPPRTAKFYVDNFGGRVVQKMRIPDGRTIIWVDIKGALVLVMKPRPGTRITPTQGPPPLEHFGLRTNDLVGAIKELKAKGVKVTMEVKELIPKFFIAYVQDPQGVSIELVQDNR